MLSPSFNRITNRMRSSITELSFHGIPLPAPFQEKKCNPCLRYVLLPMCRAAQSFLSNTTDRRRGTCRTLLRSFRKFKYTHPYPNFLFLDPRYPQFPPSALGSELSMI